MLKLENPAISNKVERELIEKLATKFCFDISPTKKMARFDGIDNKNKVLVECKNRSNTYNKYPTTMIGADKIAYWKSKYPDFTLYFCVNFTDGAFYYKWDNEEEIKIAEGGRCDRGKQELKDYCYVPIELLNKLD